MEQSSRAGASGQYGDALLGSAEQAEDLQLSLFLRRECRAERRGAGGADHAQRRCGQCPDPGAGLLPGHECVWGVNFLQVRPCPVDQFQWDTTRSWSAGPDSPALIAKFRLAEIVLPLEC
jgi:hypothetical protein